MPHDRTGDDRPHGSYKANASRPAEVWWYVPFPAVVLLGVRPFVPRPSGPCRRCGGPTYDGVCRATVSEWVDVDGGAVLSYRECRGSGRFTRPDDACHVCKGRVVDLRSAVEGVPDTVVVCGQCSRMDEAREEMVSLQRGEATAAEDAADRARRDREWAAESAASFGRDDVLSEVDRRRIWLGYADPGSARPALGNAAAAGREFLRAVGQEPDWTLMLDRHGTPVGRWEQLPESPDYHPTEPSAMGPDAEVWNARSPGDGHA